MHSSARTHVRRALPLVLLALAACGDDEGGPRLTEELPLTALEFRTRAEQIGEVSGQAPIRALNGFFFGFASQRGPATGARAIAPPAPGPLGAVRGALDLGAPRGQIGTPFFSPGAIGRTYRRDAMGTWVVDTLANGTPRPGAPATGLRFMLEDVDMFGGSSGAIVGTIDVTPTGGSPTSLEYRAVARTLDGTMVLQYDSESSATAATATGDAIAGTRRIEMAESATLRGFTGTTTATFAGISRTVDYEGDVFDESVPVKSTIVLRIDDEATVRVVWESTPDASSYRVFSNGALFARISQSSFDPIEPTWLRGDGKTPLDAEDTDALFAMYEMMNALPNLFAVDINVQFWLFELMSEDMT